MLKYQFDYEYEDKEGKYRHVHCCTVYDDYKTCDEALAEQISDMIDKGYTQVQGSIKEIEEEYL